MKNLRLLFVLPFVLFIINSAVAQLRIGIVCGRTESKLSLEELDSLKTDFSTRTGLGLGAVIDFGSSQFFNIRLEPMYLQKGAEKEINDLEFGPIKSSLNLSYVELPVLLKLSFNKGGINPYLVGGAAISYLLEAQEEFGDEYLEFGFEKKQDMKDEFKNLDYGFSYGGGLSIPIGNSSLFAEGRYTEGLTNINDIVGSMVNIKTRGW
ncbi:MAG: porin family protein [bacterium]